MKSATRIQQFLHPGKSNGQGATAMLIGSSGFVEEVGSRADPDRFNVTTFHETSFAFPGNDNSASPFLSTDFWSVRSSNLKITDGLLNAAEGPNFDSIEITSGLCLWSMDVLVGSSGGVSNPCDLLTRMCWSGESAEAILDRLELSPPTLYEVEGICRLSSAIADMAGTIQHRLQTSGAHGKPIRITLDLPGMQYYYMAIQSRKSGFWTSGQGQRYADIIQQRRSRVGNVFRKTIALELSARGIPSLDAANISIAIATGTEAAEKEMRCMLDEGSREDSVADVERVILALRRDDGSGLWAEYLDLLGSKAMPSAPQELAAASYVFQVLKPALQKMHEKRVGAKQTARTLERVLMIEFDSVAEWRIYARADQLLKKLHKQQLKQDGIDAVLFGVFPVERILTSQATGRANLYLHDPGQRMWERDDSGDELGPLSAARKVFREQTVDALKELFRLEGFRIL
ncbi:hypothetical protein SLS56_011473 [Neofusicoccum ribis]|uniref:Uncharacterized protein n=1 Tax=Neofusicoccum ribis TaxID=45134 RepID=A0ABR3SBK2_9PEZI